MPASDIAVDCVFACVAVFRAREEVRQHSAIGLVQRSIPNTQFFINMIDWQPISTNIASDTVRTVDDAGAKDLPYRFYRAVQQS